MLHFWLRSALNSVHVAIVGSINNVNERGFSEVSHVKTK
uniref:Uncharacterized protein n=1 Tax=Anguilla anguilla TaxID=7936 RepID=A0A0E9Q762_ANGAN